MNEHRVLVTWSGYAEPGLRKLREAGCEVRFLTGTQDKAEVDRILATEAVDAVLSRTVEIDAAALRSCPSLKVISKHGAGVNNIDIAAATELGIPVTRTPGANAPSVAELAIGLMVAAARQIPWLSDEVSNARWTRPQDGVQLGGQTLGVLGFGQVGSRVAEAARALGMRVRTYDPVLLGAEPPEGVRVCSTPEELLRGTDVLSLHVPLTETTQGMIGPERLALLSDGAIVVNTARGPVIDEEALVAALTSGSLRAAALDTVAVEPVCADNPLLSLDNVIITPHVGGSTTTAVAAVGEATADNAIAVLSGGHIDTRNLVNPEANDTSAEHVRRLL